MASNAGDGHLMRAGGGIAFGGAEATIVLRERQPAVSLTTPAIAPSELLG